MYSQTIDIHKGRSNNLQFLRFVAAVLVIFNHSFILSSGTSSSEWFVRLTNGQYTFGALAVSFFFFCSGFFAMKTVSNTSDNGIRLIINRYLRLIKPLALVVVLSVIIGSSVSKLSLRGYYFNAMTWRYLLNALLVLQHELPGVFQDNIYVSAVNGSLWTLSVEFLCFVMCVVGYKLSILNKRLTKYIICPVVVLGLLIKYLLLGDSLLSAAISPALIFFVGMVFYLYQDKIVLDIKWCVLCLVGIVVFDFLGLLDIAMILLFPYVCAYICFNARQLGERMGSLGDYSYAIYLWGFPVQQFVISMFGGSMNSYLNFVISLPIVILMGVVTHKVVE